ncbi:hypothetical protein [Ancylobacter sp. TS-1]|uniref:hypothetical protein n=1 Tax=Ancylobacter sp. TS-1 TaxID=1850374 RepID=UPI00139207A5|nr:hypothetical protein [Ancylobacter sp. TS-1]
MSVSSVDVAAFGFFAASFLMGPIGGIVVGHVGERYASLSPGCRFRNCALPSRGVTC